MQPETRKSITPFVKFIIYLNVVWMCILFLWVAVLTMAMWGA